MKEKRGFTLIESLITISILTILFTLGIYGITMLNRSIAEYGARDVESIIASAARRARNGSSGSPWGVYFPYDEETRKTEELIMFAGDSYATRDQSLDILIVFNEDIEFKNVSLSGDMPSEGDDHEIVFELFSGLTDNYGSITIETFQTERTVSISELGVPVREY